MSYTSSLSESISFSITHARHIAAKVATDLKRIQRFYGAPSDASIGAYESEVTLLLKHGYLGKVAYGFRRGDVWIEPTLRYSARDLAGGDGNDDDPGRIRPGADVSKASFYSYLTRSAAWHALPKDQQDAFERQLPFQRGGAPEPTIDGYLQTDRTYSAGGRALERESVRAAR